MRLTAVLTVSLAVVIGLVRGAGAQGVPVGAPALAVPVNGQIAVVGGSASQTNIFAPPFFSTVYVGSKTTQRVDVHISLPVLGIPMEGQASTEMVFESKRQFIVFSSTSGMAKGEATLHGSAGDATVAILVDNLIHGTSYDPNNSLIHVRGVRGTGMFEGVAMAGTLKNMFQPTGTIYLTYPSTDAALAAIERGLAGNPSLTDALRQQYLADARQALAQASLSAFPPATATPGPSGTEGAAPARAEVASAVTYPSAGQAQIALRIVVPAGPSPQVVKIVAVGPDGSVRTILNETHAPGDVITTTAAARSRSSCRYTWKVRW